MKRIMKKNNWEDVLRNGKIALDDWQLEQVISFIKEVEEDCLNKIIDRLLEIEVDDCGNRKELIKRLNEN